MLERAVVLISGGLDSATTLAIAISEGYECYALSFDYGQRHAVELASARAISDRIGAKEWKLISFDLGEFGGSALTDMDIPVPLKASEGIPLTYVPARNTVFLSFALGWAEVLSADHIYIGVNAVDYSGYPDCRPEYIEAFERMAGLATKSAVEGNPVSVVAPLIHLSKSDIIRKGVELGVDYSVTVSCYQPDSDGRACGRCDSCRIRTAGFQSAGVEDPTRYMQGHPAPE
jgi:7-cyano-7-deazaguanine synthase|tara:strand:- start:10609 stop:11301 length:693 start_codon:yes stop_codon:yes gene_type:complete